MDRRQFLKRAGIGTAALAALPAFPGVVLADDGDEDDSLTKFYFVALSGQAAAINAGESIGMTGRGRFGASGVRGGGEFTHFDGTGIPSPNFIATGGWKAAGLLGYQQIGTWGRFAAGILDLAIEVRPCDGSVISGATLRIVCNIGPAGIRTSPFMQEGFTLSIPGMAPFQPFTPNIGLTLFTVPCPGTND